MTEQFKNDDYTVELTKDSGCRVDFCVSMSPKASLAQWKKAVRTINKQVSLPGFRKGKAPESIIAEQYKSYVEKEWKEELLREGFQQSVRLAGTYPMRQESIQKAKVEKASKEEPSTLFFSFETAPDVPDINLNTLSFTPAEPAQASDEEIEKIIEDIRYQNCDWEEVADREVQDGDFVDIDIENLDNSGEMLTEDTRVEVVKEKMGSWLFDTLIGMKIGDSREETSREEGEEPMENFTPTRCKITVKGIFTAKLPPVDDELAKQAKADSVEDLQNRIRKDLGNSAKRDTEKQNRAELIKLITQEYDFAIPHSLLTQEQQRLLTDKAQQINGSSLPAEEKQAALAEAEKEAQREAQTAIRWQFIADKVAYEKNMDVDRNEIYLELVKGRMANPNANPDTESEQEQQQTVMRAYRRVISQKVADLFLDQLETKKSGKTA